VATVEVFRLEYGDFWIPGVQVEQDKIIQNRIRKQHDNSWWKLETVHHSV